MRLTFQVEGEGPLVVNFAYRNCNTYNNNEPLNTTNLIFDCDGGPMNNASQFSAQIIQPPNTQPGLNLELNGEYAQALHANLAAIAVAPITTTQFGAPGDEITRTFTVTIRSHSIQSFELQMIMENDVIVAQDSPLMITTAGQEDIVLSFFALGNNFFNEIILSNYPNHVIESDNFKTITFKQKVNLLCAANVTPPLINASTINARVACLCGGNSQFFNATQATLNGIAGTNPSIANISTNLVPSDNVAAPCSGFYEYYINVPITGATARLNQIQIPINTTSFAIQSISLGTPNSLVPINNFIANNADPAQGVIIIPTSSNFNPNSPWPGFVNSFNGTPGAWFNIPDNGPLNLVVQIVLQYNCNSINACHSSHVSLTPFSNNNLILSLTNNCSSDSENSNTLPSIAAPVTEIETLSGGCIPFNLDVGSITSAPFSYFINLPGQSPFQLNHGNNALFDCNNVSYRAVLSIGSPAGFNVGNITNLTINGQNATAQGIDGNLVFDLPTGLNPNNPTTSFNINFILNGISCPDPVATFGSIEYILTAQAVCNDCIGNPCVKNVGCNKDILFVHCPGPCDSRVGIDADLTIHRTTFGWADPSDYPGNTLTNLDFIGNDIERENQLRRLYPFDLFRINGSGSVQPTGTGNDLHQYLSFEMAYSNNALGANFFDLAGYQINFRNSTTNQIITINDLNIPYEFMPATENAIAGLNNSMWVRELRWQANDLAGLEININTAAWVIENFEATFRVVATEPIGFFECDFLCQFKSESHLTNGAGELTGTTTHTSCDPYGSSILVLIPDVELVQQSTQSGNLLLPGDTQNQPAAVISPDQTCRFGHAIGIRHRGGLGNHVDDFPFEFRPLTAWPGQLNAPQASSVNDLYNGTFNYSSSNPFTNTVNTNALLPPLEKGQITEPYQGLVLTMNRTCAINNQSTIPLTLPINPFAYIHGGHIIEAVNPIPALNPQDVDVPSGMQCPAMMNFPTPNIISGVINIPNGTTIYNFRLSAPAAAQGLPVVLRIILNQNDPAIDVTLGNLVFNENTLNPNANGWYVFNNGLPNITSGTNASIPIILGEGGCFDETFEIRFEWRIFCTDEQKIAFLNNSTNLGNCVGCFRTLNFRRSASNIANAQITNNFSVEECELVWTLNIANPVNQPDINLSNLSLDFTTGMIYQAANLEIVNSENTNPTLAPPSFALIQEENPSVTYIQTTLATSSLNLQSGCTLRYTLRFQLSESLCNSYEGGSIIRANLNGKNVCNDIFQVQPISINNSSINGLIANLSNQTPSCCLPLPSLEAQHACGGTQGHISFINNLGFPITIILMMPDGSQISQNVEIDEQFNSVPLAAGDYGLIIQNMDNGAFLTQTFSIEAYPLPTVNINSTGFLCQGGTPTQLNANSPTAEEYSWNDGIASDESTFWTNQANNTVTVTDANGCQNTANNILISLMPLQPYQITIDGSTQLCPNETVTLTATPFHAANTYTWVDANGITLGTGQQIQINQNASVQLLVSAGPNTGCSFLATNGPINIESDLSFCDCLCRNGIEAPVILDNIATQNDILSFFQSADGMISNRCFKVNNSFIIDGPFNLQNCELFMASGTQIWVDQNGIFQAIFNTEIQGCDEMWRGIINHGTLRFSHVTISDAQYAVTAGRSSFNQPTTILSSTRFRNNYIGFTNWHQSGNYLVNITDCVFDGGLLKPNFIGQTPPAAERGGLAGIRIHNKFILTLDKSTSFNDLFNGIISNYSILNINDTRFTKSWYSDDQPLYHYAYSNNINIDWQNPMVYGTLGAAINAFNSSIVNVSGSDPDVHPDYVMFDGYKNAISAERSSLNVANCRLTGSNEFPLETGIKVFGPHGHQGFNIVNTRITAVKRGIEVYFNSSFGSSIRENSIWMLEQYNDANTLIVQHPVKDGIFMAFDGAQKAPVIFNNFVTSGIANRTNGIFAQYVHGLEIIGNQNTRIGNAPGYSFGTELCKGLLRHNESFKLFSQINPPVDDYSFNFTHSNLDIFENCSQNTKFGFNFEDNCVNTKFIKNRIGLHQPFDPVDRGGALRIGVNGVIADQVDRMNFFETHPNNPQAIIAVKELDVNNPTNPTNQAYGRFTVQTNTLSPYDEQNYYPVHQPENNDCEQDEFFRCIPISSGNSNSTQCQFNMPPMIGTPENKDELRKVLSALAKDSIHFGQFEEVSLHHLERTFEQLIHKQQIAVPDTGVFVAYKQALINSNTAKFNRAEEAISSVELSSAQAASLEELQMSTAALLDLMHEKDSLMALNEAEIDTLLMNEYTQLQAQLLQKQDEWETWSQQYQAMQLTKADSMAYWNAAVSPQRAFETAERDLNNLIERTVARGIYYFDASEKQLIESLAYQCPLVGGPAVYKARALFYSYATDYFDNYALCNMAGIQFRRPAPESQAEEQAPMFSVFPNPNNGNFTIQWNGEAGPISIRVHDLSGRLVHSSSMSSNESLLSLPSDLLSNGIYLLELFHITTQHTQHEKLIISK